MKIINKKIIITAALFITMFLVDADISEEKNTGSSQEGVEMIVNANNRFTFDLYGRLNDSKDQNIFYSPYSILTALAMTYEGAKGQTAEQMQAVLHIPENADIRRPGFSGIYDIINKKDSEYKLSTANALWAQKNYEFLEAYIECIKEYYGGEVTNLDFAGAAEESRQIINKWVEDQTNKKIKDLIPQGMLSAMTRLVLTNAIYFKGIWIKQFDEKETYEEDFRTNAGDTVKVLMMRLCGHDARFKYTENDEVQILELPYKGDELSMLIILPKDDLTSVEGMLSLETLSTWQNMLYAQRVDIYIPRFKFKTKYLMADILSDMGMPVAFSAGADFSGMDGTRELFIQNVIHQAFVEVNEEGTEAAAATAVVMEATSAVRHIPVFRADHPFIFMIKQTSTNNILFMGRVSDPSE
jgi:serpin B